MKRAGIMILAVSIAGCSAWSTLREDDLVPQSTMARVFAAREATAEQKATFGALAELPGRTFRGEPTGHDPDAVADIQHWSWAENGQALRIRHVLEDGSYGGESIVRRDERSGQLVFVYKTSAGFQTEGVYHLQPNGGWETIEEVTGGGEITKVRGKGYLRHDGSMVSNAEFFSNGEWVPAHGFVYKDYSGEVPELAADEH